MALITIDPEEEVEYIPLFDRKNKLDPLIIMLTFMSNGEHIEYMANMAREMGTTNDPEKQTKISKAYDRKKFIEHVKGFKNWNKMDGTPEPNDAGSFYDRNDADLIYEIQSAYASNATLTACQKKTSGED